MNNKEDLFLGRSRMMTIREVVTSTIYGALRFLGQLVTALFCSRGSVPDILKKPMHKKTAMIAHRRFFISNQLLIRTATTLWRTSVVHDRQTQTHQKYYV